MPHPARAMHRALLQGEPWCIAAAGLSSLADRVGKREKGKRKSEIFVWCGGWLVAARNSSQACIALRATLGRLGMDLRPREEGIVCRRRILDWVLHPWFPYLQTHSVSSGHRICAARPGFYCDRGKS